jgi:hypothetical protein
VLVLGSTLLLAQGLRELIAIAKAAQLKRHRIREQARRAAWQVLIDTEDQLIKRRQLEYQALPSGALDHIRLKSVPLSGQPVSKCTGSSQKPTQDERARFGSCTRAEYEKLAHSARKRGARWRICSEQQLAQRSERLTEQRNPKHLPSLHLASERWSCLLTLGRKAA